MLWYRGRDELFYLRNLQPVLDGVRAVSAGKSNTGIQTQLTDLATALDRTGDSWFKYRYVSSLLALSTIENAGINAMKTETQRRMTIVAIALTRFSLVHARPPGSLELLVPDFLPAVPLDPMAGEPFRYRLHSDQSFTLYSVGFDGIDHGGDPTRAQPGQQPGFWEGRDAVWPWPVPDASNERLR